MQDDMMEEPHRGERPDHRGRGPRGHRHGRHHEYHHERPDERPHGPRRRGGPMDYGDLRLIALSLLAEEPRHGYDLIREFEARSGGSYTPSPGAIYPVLHWLEDMGHARAEADGVRKSYALTPEGRSFLAANAAALEIAEKRLRAASRAEEATGPLREAMKHLTMALRARQENAPLDAETVREIAAAIEELAHRVEKA